LCNAIGLVGVCRYNLPACPERFKMMAEAAHIDTVGMTAYQADEKFIDAVEELRSELGIRKNFKDLGIYKKDLDVCAKGVLNPVGKEGRPMGDSDAIRRTKGYYILNRANISDGVQQLPKSFQYRCRSCA
jgi:alcohol dehydrogenase class IV